MNQKSAVITGASSGIGLLTAVELARRGYQVVATMRDASRRMLLEEAAANAGVAERIQIRRLDVTEIPSIPLIVNDILRDHGRIDVLVNNAGFAMAGFAEDLQLGEIREQLDTNFFGQVAVTQAVLPAMRARRSGHIIMVSSVTGVLGQPGISAYSASKFALEGWSEALRLEMRPLGVRVVLVEPGSFATDIWTRNARVGASVMSLESPNAVRTERFRKMVRKLPKGDANRVARLIASIADNPNPRLRYMIGGRAFLQKWTRAAMPWRWYEKLMMKAMRME